MIFKHYRHPLAVPITKDVVKIIASYTYACHSEQCSLHIAIAS